MSPNAVGGMKMKLQITNSLIFTISGVAKAFGELGSPVD
jgi:hypothetical protein